MKFTMYNLQFTIKFVFLIFTLFVFLYPVPFALNPTHAQTDSLDASYSYQVVDPEAKDGDILIYTDKGLVRSDNSFSTAMFGIMQSNPLVVVQLNPEDNQAVIKSGIATVNVTTANGPIKKGDYITSSTDRGKGQKADKSGYMLGIAMADFSDSAPGQIPVSLNIQYVDLYSMISPAANKFLKSMDNILLASTQDPEKFTRLVRYLSAALIMLGAFVISLFTFSKASANSIEAIGRNPLAKKVIFMSLVVNMVVVLGVLIAGLITSFILIKI